MSKVIKVVSKKSISKLPRDKTVAGLKKIGVVGGIKTPIKGDWQLERERQKEVSKMLGQSRPNKQTKLPLQLSNEAVLQMGRDRASGVPTSVIAEKYGIAEEYVGTALKRFYTSNGKGREALKSLVLENALACGEKARQTVGQLQPMQAVVATGIFTQRFIDLDKHTQNMGPEIDMEAVERAGRLISQLDDALGVQVEEIAPAEIDFDNE